MRALLSLAKLNPGLMAGVAIALLSAGFGAGWVVNDWRRDSGDNKELKQAADQARADLATLDEMADGAIYLTRWLGGHTGRFVRALNEELAGLSIDTPAEFEREKKESGDAVSYVEDGDDCRLARPSRRMCEQRAARLGLSAEMCRAL